MEYLEHRIAREEAEREQQYLESIGPLGRLIDNNLTFPFVLLVACVIGFGIGILIGKIL